MPKEGLPEISTRVTLVGRKVESSIFVPIVVPFFATVDFFLKQGRFKVEGNLPEDGAAIITGIHRSYTVPQLALAGATLHRTVQCVVRDTLIDPKAKDTQSVLNRNEGTGAVAEKNSLFSSLTWWLRAGFIKAGDPLPVHRGGPATSQIKDILMALKEGRVIIMYLNESTRSDQTFPGVSRIAQKTDVPVYASYVKGRFSNLFTGDPIIFRIGSPRVFSKADLDPKDPNSINLFTEMLVNDYRALELQ